MKALYLIILLAICACKNNPVNSNEKDNDLEHHTENSIDTLKPIITDSIYIENKELKMLLFSEPYTQLTDYPINTFGGVLFNWLKTNLVLNSDCNVYSQDSLKILDNGILDYCNSTILVELYLESDINPNVLINKFKKYFFKYRSNVHKFLSIKPGFILILQHESIIIILLNDCGDRKKFIKVEKYVNSKHIPETIFVGYCGLNARQ